MTHTFKFVDENDPETFVIHVKKSVGYHALRPELFTDAVAEVPEPSHSTRWRWWLADLRERFGFWVAGVDRDAYHDGDLW